MVPQTYVELTSEEDIKKASKLLLDKGVKNIIITLGSKGSCLVNSNEFTFIKSVSDVKSVDPTAAGDSFIGSFVAFLHYGFDVHKALLLVFTNHKFSTNKITYYYLLITVFKQIYLIINLFFKKVNIFYSITWK